MPTIEHKIYIHAPIHICFDLARDIEVHMETTKKTKEKVIGSTASGLMEIGDTVTWQARHFGIKQKLTAKITEMQKPYIFTDVMVKGAFLSFTHTHQFTKRGTGTVMQDTFTYKSPWGIFGTLADQLFLEKHLEKFLSERARELKRIAEKGRHVPK